MKNIYINNNIKLHWKSFATNILNKYSDNKVKITQILTKT